MNKAGFDRGFEITFNWRHGKHATALITREFFGGWQLEHKNGT
jgi:hypothetical protein